VLYLERPLDKRLRVHDLGRALQIQRLEGSRPWGLWDLYVDEPVLIVCEVAAAVGALRAPLVIAERMVWGGTSESLERTAILHSE
jgi:hypothetical protein